MLTKQAACNFDRLHLPCIDVFLVLPNLQVSILDFLSTALHDIFEYDIIISHIVAWHLGRVSMSHACAGMWQVGYSLACVCKPLWTDSLPSPKAATQPSCNGLSIQSMGPWRPFTTLLPICACTQLVTCHCLRWCLTSSLLHALFSLVVHFEHCLVVLVLSTLKPYMLNTGILQDAHGLSYYTATQHSAHDIVISSCGIV